nr:hypothetical protein [Bacteroidales bacterium]
LDYLPTFELVGPVPLNATPKLLYLEQRFTAYIPDTESTSNNKEFMQVSVHEYNRRLYSNYRWFPEYVKPPLPEGFNNQNWDTCPLPLKIEWQQKNIDSFLKIYPADLRERRIKLWGNDTMFCVSNYTFFIRSEDTHVRTNESINLARLDSDYTFQTNITH